METYNKFVGALIKSGSTIKDQLTPEDANIWHLTSGVCGEAGELLDAVKKAVVYRKPLDLENVIEELGDIEFYLEGLRQALAIDRATVIDHNMKKLSKRYGEKYSDQAAINREDKK